MVEAIYDPNNGDGVDVGNDNSENDYHNFNSELEDVDKPLCEWCTIFTMFLALVVLYNSKATSVHSDESFTKIFKLLVDILRETNKLSYSMYEMKRI